MSWLGRFGAIAVLFAVASLAVGCGGTNLDLSKTEDQIQANIENTRDTKVASVDCPSGVAVDPGATFSCTVHLSGGDTATATLRIRDEDANLDFVNLQPDK
jgi:NAD(P)H-hydrate repair Nnr-like enzyme with NAD(P)H-hydrate epimerase domain